MEKLTINNIINSYDKMDSYPLVTRNLLVKWKNIKNKTDPLSCSNKNDQIYLILGEFPITFETVIDANILVEAQNKYISQRNLKSFISPVNQKEIDEYTTFITMINTITTSSKRFKKQNEDEAIEEELKEVLQQVVRFKQVVMPEKEEEEETISCCMPWSNTKSTNEQYIFYNSMDDNNKKAMDVWTASGVDAAVKHMVTRPDGTARSYSEMRMLYG